MARGVSDQFLRILDNERRVALRHAAFGGALALVLLFMANLADEPLFGTESFLYAVTLFLGIGAGVAFGWWRARRFSASIKTGWNAWMRASLGSETVEDVYRRATNQRPRSTVLSAIAAAGLFAANLLLFSLLWIAAPSAGAVAFVMMAANGGYVGVWLGVTGWRFGWARSFTHALEDLMRDGVIGVRGEL